MNVLYHALAAKQPSLETIQVILEAYPTALKRRYRILSYTRSRP